MVIRMTLGEAITKARSEGPGWTQEQLAEAVGIDQPTVSRWENNKQEPSLAQITKIDEVTGHRRGFVLVAAGYIDEPKTVRDWIEMDPAIDDRLRDFILGLYDDSRFVTRRSRPATKPSSRRS